ncbi:ZIP family metal transporter [Candidatus Desantisbacteria bacterium]|nr:ZIP family metal transporter [Candidatus Desantisbacteria bacterium]
MILNIFLSILTVSLISLIGIASFIINKKNMEMTLIFLVSFSAGSLLGDCFIHILPEIIKKINFGLAPALLILCGILLFFILEKFIFWRHCHVPTSSGHPHPIVLMNLVGDGLHNFIDGMVIAGSYLLNTHIGLTTTIAIIFHEIPQEIGDFGVLIYGGFTKKKALFFNFLSSLTAFLGAGFVLILKDSYQDFSTLIMAFTVGGFIYIAGVDLLPELKKETELNKSLLQMVSFILGMGIMVFFVYME